MKVPYLPDRADPARLRVENEQGHRYYVHPLTGESLMSVTTVLSATDGKERLIDWTTRLAAEFVASRLDELADLVAAQGWQAAVTRIKQRVQALREIKRDTGSYVHQACEALALWQGSPEGTGHDVSLPPLPEHLRDAWYDHAPVAEVADQMIQGFINFVADFNPEILATEMVVFHRGLGVAGTLDLIIELRDVAVTSDGRLVPAPGNVVTLCVDIKTGGELEATIHEQLAAYRRCLEALAPLGEIIPMPATDAAAVLHLRPEHPDGYRLIVVSAADDAKGWNRFRRVTELALGRAEAAKKLGKVARPLRADGTMPPPRLADLEDEGANRALTPLIVAGLTDLGQVAAYTDADLLDIPGIGPKLADDVRALLSTYDMSLTDDPHLALEGR